MKMKSRTCEFDYVNKISSVVQPPVLALFKEDRMTFGIDTVVVVLAHIRKYY